MRVLLLTTYENLGGAAKAVQRLHRGLKQLDIDSRIAFQFSDAEMRAGAPSVTAKLRRKIDQFPLRLYRDRQPLPFSPAIVPKNIERLTPGWQPDIIHLNWINHGFISIESLANVSTPMVWTFHDSWPFTGGCHIPLSCTRYRENCGRCPELGSASEKDLSTWVLNRKKRSWNNLKFRAITPSHWLAGAARSSVLMHDREITVIPNGVDLDIFKPRSSAIFRERHQIAAQKKIILVGAMEATRDLNKGFHLFISALQELKKLARTAHFDEVGALKLGSHRGGFQAEDFHVVTFGGDQPGQLSIEGFSATQLGTVTDDAVLAEAYAAADVFVCPSLLENLPYTIIESMACGTPVVAFKTGGIGDLITHGENGYLAEPFLPESLAKGIKSVLTSLDDPKLRAGSRAFAQDQLSLSAVASRYVQVYKAQIEKPQMPYF